MKPGAQQSNSISRMQAKGSRMLWGAHGMRPIRFERRYSFRRAGRSIRAARLIRKFASCWMVQQRAYRRKRTLCIEPDTELEMEARGLPT